MDRAYDDSSSPFLAEEEIWSDDNGSLEGEFIAAGEWDGADLASPFVQEQEYESGDVFLTRSTTVHEGFDSDWQSQHETLSEPDSDADEFYEADSQAHSEGLDSEFDDWDAVIHRDDELELFLDDVDHDDETWGAAEATEFDEDWAEDAEAQSWSDDDDAADFDEFEREDFDGFDHESEDEDDDDLDGRAPPVWQEELSTDFDLEPEFESDYDDDWDEESALDPEEDFVAHERSGLPEDIVEFATSLGQQWSSRLDGKISPAEKTAELLSDYRDTMQGAQRRWKGKRFSADEIKNGWKVSRQEEMEFRTNEAPGLRRLRNFRPRRGLANVQTPLIRRSDKAPVAPIMVRFVKALRRRYGRRVSATTYRGHGAGRFDNQGHSIDIWLGARDERGFYPHETAVKMMRAIHAAAQDVNVNWRVLYNDFSVADKINRETGGRHVVFMGKVRKSRRRGVTGLNWHGPHPFILHFHLDIAPGVGYSGRGGSGAPRSRRGKEIIKFVQRVLNHTEGENLDDDGVVGRLTRAALKRFRNRHDIASSGRGLDAKTELAIVQRALEQVAQQSLFAQLGERDPQTDEAIRSFRLNHGLSDSTEIDASFRTALTTALARGPGTEEEHSEGFFFPPVSVPSMSSATYPLVTLSAVSGATGLFQEYYDPFNTGIPLIDSSGRNRRIQLSRNFKVGEFAQAEQNKFKFDKSRIDPALVEFLQQLRDISQKSIRIVDGFYSYDYLVKLQKRKRLTTLPISPHLSGQGAKITIKGWSGLQIARWAVLAFDKDTRIGIGRRSITIFVKQRDADPTSWLRGKRRDRDIGIIEQYRRILFEQPERIRKLIARQNFRDDKDRVVPSGDAEKAHKLLARWAIEDQNVTDERILTETLFHGSPWHVYQWKRWVDPSDVAEIFSRRRMFLEVIRNTYVRPALARKGITPKQGGPEPSAPKGEFVLADDKPELPGISMEGRYEYTARQGSKVLGATLVMNQAGRRIEAVWSEVWLPRDRTGRTSRTLWRYYGDLQEDGTFLMQDRNHPDEEMRLRAVPGGIEVQMPDKGSLTTRVYRQVSSRPVLFEHALGSFPDDGKARENDKKLILASEHAPLLSHQKENLRRFFGDGAQIKKYLKDFYDIGGIEIRTKNSKLRRESIGRFDDAIESILEHPRHGINSIDDTLASFYIRRLLSLQFWQSDSNSPTRSLLDWTKRMVSIAAGEGTHIGSSIRRFVGIDGELPQQHYKMILEFDAGTVGLGVGIGGIKGWITITKEGPDAWDKPYRYRLIGGALSTVLVADKKLDRKYTSEWSTTDSWDPNEVPGWFQLAIGSASFDLPGVSGGGSSGFLHLSGSGRFSDSLQFVFKEGDVQPKGQVKKDFDADATMYIGRIRSRDFDFSGFESTKIQRDYATSYGLRKNSHFGFDSALLTAEARQAVRIMCANELPAMMNNGSELKIVGHTDRRGRKSYNLGLSAARAANVKQAVDDILGSKLKISSKSRCSIPGPGVCVEGRGEAEAAAAGKPDGRRDAKDRRVDITLNSRLVLRLSEK